ncbi:MAG: response regulator [Deltaproteobacteria bacterium]|nr:response regulator [Deltaproteobacteria bacterium]
MKTILIVDDSSSARLFIQRCFEVSGFNGSQFLEAENGQKAIEVLGGKPVDLLVTDLTMPEVDGLGLLQWAKKNKPQLPVLVITSSGNEARKAELMSAGAKSVLIKPISPAVIQETMKSL